MPDRNVKLLLDTDIGSNIDDAVALAYLLCRPRCELLGITTVTGQPTLRAEDGPHTVAKTVDANRFCEHYFSIVK